MDTFFEAQNSDHPSDLVKFKMSAFNSIELAFWGVGVNFSPLQSRFFSSSVSLWDEKLNIFGQIIVLCCANWLVVPVGVLLLPLLLCLGLGVMCWLLSPRWNKKSAISSFVVLDNDVLSVFIFIVALLCVSVDGCVIVGLWSWLLFMVLLGV